MKKCSRGFWGLLFLTFFYLYGKEAAVRIAEKGREQLLYQAQKTCVPKLVYQKEEETFDGRDWILEQAEKLLPLVSYLEDTNRKETSEDEETIAKILEAEANDENQIGESGELIGKEQGVASGGTENAPVDLSPEKLGDFEYLLSHFYTVDSTTMIGPEQLNAAEMMGKNMKIGKGDGPKVLIFHTHSQEAFADSVPGDASTSIVGVGTYLTELLNQKGIPTIHDTGVYDIIDGKLDRSRAYEQAETAIRKVLQQNPSVEVVIDLHRDGVREETRLVTEIGGKQTAKIMFFNGLSRTRANGNIAYLVNPYIQDNLAFSFQMQLMCETYYPGFARRIYLKGYRYSLHMMPKSLLIEAGAQTNTVQEMKNAMEVLSETLYRVLVG